MEFIKINKKRLSEYLEHVNGGGYLEGGGKMHEFMHLMSERARQYTFVINREYLPQERLRKLFFELLNKPEEPSFRLFPPFYTDFGLNINIGKNVFINEGCCFQDQGGITIGDGCLIGQQVVLATLNHSLDPARRADMLPAPITLGKNVWVGAHATILAGVTVGDGSVIAAGAVVTKDMPAGCVAGGVPAKIIKRL